MQKFVTSIEGMANRIITDPRRCHNHSEGTEEKLTGWLPSLETAGRCCSLLLLALRISNESSSSFHRKLFIRALLISH